MIERLTHFQIKYDSKGSGGSQPVLPSFETQLPLREQEKEKRGKKEKEKRPKDNGVRPIIRVPDSVYERPTRERKDID